MTENLEIQSDADLQKIEREIYLIYFQDGLWDMLLGCTLIAFGIGLLTYEVLPEVLDTVLGIILWLIAFVAFFLAKAYIIRPRMGIVKYNFQRKKQLKSILIVTIACVVVSIVVLILTITDTLNFKSLGIGIAFIFGIIPLMIFGLMALFFNYYRLFIHAGVYSFAIVSNEILTQFGYKLIGNICFISGGAILLAIGIVYFAKFLKKYPAVRGDEVES